MAKKHLFTDSKIGYDEFLKTIQGVLDNKPILCYKDNVEVGVEGFLKIDDPIQRQKAIDSSFIIDKQFDSPNSKDDNIFIKLPIILGIGNLMGNYADYVKDLDYEELALLGAASFTVDDKEYITSSLKILGNKEILSAIIEKTSNKQERVSILGVVMDKYESLSDIEKNDNMINSFKKDVTTMIKSNSREDLLGMVKPIDVAVSELEELGFRM